MYFVIQKIQYFFQYFAAFIWISFVKAKNGDIIIFKKSDLETQKLFTLINFRLGDNNENQCFPYSCIVSAAIEILQSEQKLREAKMCGITLH